MYALLLLFVIVVDNIKSWISTVYFNSADDDNDGVVAAVVDILYLVGASFAIVALLHLLLMLSRSTSGCYHYHR